MKISEFCSRFFVILLATGVIFVAACFAQSTSETLTRNNFTISVQDLKMGNKGQKAFDKGSALLEKGDAAASILYLGRAIAEYPEHYKAYYDLGVAHYRLGHMAEAEQAFQKSIDLTAGHFALAQFGMGMLLCQQEQFQQAETVIQRGLESDPGSARGKFFLGWAQYGLNRLIESERTLRQALLRNANLGEAYALLARIHQRQANPPAVVNDLQNYLRLNPQSPEREQAKRLLETTQQQMQLEQSVRIPALTP